MIEFIIESLFTPGRLWAGTVIGVLIAICAWYLLPENIDRASIGAWSIGTGFIIGLVLSFTKNNK